MQTHRDADIKSDFNTANERLAAAESNLASLRSAAATGTTLKQKLLISQAEEHVAELRSAQQALSDQPKLLNSDSQPAKLRLRSLSKHASASEQQKITEHELAKVRAIISKTRGFSSLDQQRMDAMIAAGERTVYNKEELLILQNDVDVGYFFVLLEGCLKYVVRRDSEEPKSGLINSTDHGNVVGHFGALYRKGGKLLPIARRAFRLMRLSGAVLRVEPHQKPVLPQATQTVIPQDWADKYSRSVHEVEQLREALEGSDAQLQLARSALSECRTRCASLEITVASQELQLQAMLSQSAAEKSSFVQEKEHLQLLFDRQQQLCAGLTAQVVALTANSDNLHIQINDNTMQVEFEKGHLIKEVERWEAAAALEQQKSSEAVSRARVVEAAFADMESKLASLQSANFDQEKTIIEISQMLRAALQQVKECREQNAILNQAVYLERKSRGCQTVAAQDLDRCAFDSSASAARDALQQIKSDCSQVLMQFARDTESNQLQISKLQFRLSEKNKEFERAVAAAELRSAERELFFENQLRVCSSDLRQQLAPQGRALEEAQETSRQLQRMLAHAEGEVHASKGLVDAIEIVRQGLEVHNAQLQQENVALERNVIALRRLVSEKHGVSGVFQPHAASASSSPRDLALIVHLEGRAKESEQRAESMMFQKNEAQSRCQLAELSLEHFQRLCDSSLSLLRTSVTATVRLDDDVNADPALSQALRSLHSPSTLSPAALRRASPQLAPTLRLLHAQQPRTNLVQQAGELLAHAAGRWAAEDVEAVATAERACVELSTITLLDEVHRLRLQLGAQHMRVIKAYAEGIKSFEGGQQSSRTA